MTGGYSLTNTKQKYIGEYKLAFEWWESKTLEEQQNITYNYCMGNEMSPLEFELSDIVKAFQNQSIEGI